MIRRTIIVAFVLLAISGITPRSSAATQKYNVLMLIVDDMNDWVGCLDGYGGPSPSPHIDRLAGRGRLFSNAHCDAPVCNASRTSVLTGLRPSTTGIYDNRSWWRPNLPDAVSMPRHFAAHGYYTVGGGKVFHHMPGFNPPYEWHEYFDQVFDDHFHRPGPGEINNPRDLIWPAGFPLNGIENVIKGVRPPLNPREFDWGPFDKPDAEMGDGQMIVWAEKFLARHHEKPFFLAAGTFRPHLPWYAPRPYFERHPQNKIVMPTLNENDRDDIPPLGVELAEARGDEYRLLVQLGRYREAAQAYLASISFADALVGRLLDALERNGHLDNTIVVLWSDHGWHLGEKGHWHKNTLWEESTRVPLIIAGPPVERGGRRCTEPVNLVDIYPTLVELCGLTPIEAHDGISLVPQLRDPAAPRTRPALTTHIPGYHAVRSKDWRYIRYADGSEELYDHRNDPYEWTNLADRPEHAAVKADHARWLPTHDAPPATRHAAFNFDFETYTWTPRARKGK